MPANWPSFPEVVGSYSAAGVAKEAIFRTPVTATAFTPFDALTVEEDPAVFSPQTMLGVISTDVYPLQGEVKVDGNIKAPLFATNGIPLIIGAIGKDAQAVGSGITGQARLSTAGTPGNSTCAQNLPAGTTSITVLSGTGFVLNQVVVLEPGTNNAEVVQVTTVATNVLTVTATALVHNGTTTPFVVQTCGCTANSSAAAGASAITPSIPALFTTNDIVQVDINGTTTTSEVHKMTVSTVLTIADLTPNNTFAWAHASGCYLITVTGGMFTHTIPSGPLDSFTVEKNIGGVQSLIYPGVRFAKGSLACPEGNAAANLSIDAMGAANPFVQATPTAASVTTEAPFIFSEASFIFAGQNHPEVSNIKVDWDNVMKAKWTYTNDHHAAFLTKTNLHVSGTFDAVFHNFNDPNNGFWLMANQFTGGALTFTMQHADGSFVRVILPNVKLKKSPQTYTVGNIVTQPIQFMGFYGLTTGQANMVMQVQSTQRYLPW